MTIVNIITAIDSMKGSITSAQANSIVKEAFKDKDTLIEKVAIADGGEGTVEAFISNCGGEYKRVETYDLSGEIMLATFGWIQSEALAIIESADTAGIHLLDKTKKTHPLYTSTQGVGETIKAAINIGAKQIIIGLGGTGTIDAGIGALDALNFKFLDKDKNRLKAIGKNIKCIDSVCTNEIHPQLNDVKFILASDVSSYLTGLQGAVYMFGRQKGLLESEMKTYEKHMMHFQNEILAKASSKSGDGAAGGLGIGLRYFLQAKSISGLTLMTNYFKLNKKLSKADLVITGEGKIDDQSLQGKVPIGISRIAQRYNVPAIAFVGTIEGEPETFKKNGLSVVVPIIDKITNLNQAMNDTEQNLQRVAKRTKDLLFTLK